MPKKTTNKKATVKKASAKPSSRKPAAGRKPGSKNKDYTTSATTQTRCEKCGSTDRLPYSRQQLLDHHGTAPDGQPCTHVRLQWTGCKSCGQARIDRTYENNA
ncbi:hypothetical protein [Rubinisphaera italica]|uniref:hypothetical protein n=1 Tax=Rubinisphaera italica TaxID=2527969 RepID=UPI0011B481E8|nr:hypothetical protein [Rubinisphaera italica]